jgi:hypothetical protein
LIVKIILKASTTDDYMIFLRFLAVNIDEIRDIFVRVDFHRRQSPVFPRPAKRNALLDDGAVLTSPHH